MASTFLGLTSNAWLAIVGGLYAFATFLLAWWTNLASRRSDRSDHTIAGTQIAAASKEIAAQLAASEAAHEKQLAAIRDAAVIQARASSVSNNRQNWINSLRDEVTGFLTDRDVLDIVLNRTGEFRQDRLKQVIPLEKSLLAYVYKVRLFLNPTEGESTRLVEMLEHARYKGLESGKREEIITHTQSILKREWERVKSGE